MAYNSFKLLIFDFDGTLADTRKLYINAIYYFSRKRGYGVTKPQVKKLFGPALRKMLPGLKIKSGDVKTITSNVNNFMIRKAGNIKPCPGICVVKELSRRYRIAVVSNSHSKLLESFLKKQKLKKCFSDVWGYQFFKKEKSEAFRKLFRKYRISPREALYIADRAQDVDTARKSGCSSLIVSNRFSWSTRREVAAKKPDFLVGSLSKLKYL